MNIQNVINQIESIDPAVYDRLASRRNLFRTGTRIAAAAVPLAFGAALKDAYGQAVPGILDVLNFALTLEYIEDSFYRTALAAPNLIPASDRAVFQQISKHEEKHVSFLENAIRASGGTTVARPQVDPTAKGAYPNILTNYATFLTVSQALEDTGVAAYKGQAANLISNDAVLQAALQIHSVEARHAAEVRRIRGLKPWVSTDNGGAPAAVYANEANTTQAGVPITLPNIDPVRVQEAFDEPLTQAQVLAIAGPFIGL